MDARRAFVPVVYLLASICTALAQPRVDPRNMYERVLAIVPIVGKGTMNDPKRPMYVPPPSAVHSTSGTGILGFSFVESDDGKFALVEFVARDRAALRDILADTAVKAFLKDRDKRADIETEFKKYKKDFDFDKLGKVVVP
jgi:hypothetical protein